MRQEAPPDTTGRRQEAPPDAPTGCQEALPDTAGPWCQEALGSPPDATRSCEDVVPEHCQRLPQVIGPHPHRRPPAMTCAAMAGIPTSALS
eukprot:13444664-Alexandrium_andersonii.AAC.1